MTYPKIVRGDRARALIGAALHAPCECALASSKVHGGLCISCWALDVKLASLESLLAQPLEPDLALRIRPDGGDPDWWIHEAIQRYRNERARRREHEAGVAAERAGAHG